MKAVAENAFSSCAPCSRTSFAFGMRQSHPTAEHRLSCDPSQPQRPHCSQPPAQRLSMTRHKMTQLCFRFQPAGRKPPAPQTWPLLQPGTEHVHNGCWKWAHTGPSFSPDSRLQKGLEVDLLTEADFKVKKTILLIYLIPGRNCPWNCTKCSSRCSFTPAFRLVSTAEYESLRVNWSRILLSSHALRLLGDLSHLSSFHRRVGIRCPGGSSTHTTLQRCAEHVQSLETSLPFPPPRFLHLKNQSKQTMLHPLFYREPLKTSHSFHGKKIYFR